MTVLEILSAVTAFLDSLGILQFIQAALLIVVAILALAAIREALKG
jgi:hypothetical protein